MTPKKLQEPTRKGSTALTVYCLPDELATIKAKASMAGLSVSTYLRRLGLGYEPRSILDHEYVAQLERINADQARLGNLLKMWLADDVRLHRFDPDQMTATIQLAMDRVGECQSALLEAANKGLKFLAAKTRRGRAIMA